MQRVWLLLALCSLMETSMGFPGGAPSSTCINMLPVHYYRGRYAVAQRSSAPYNILLDSDNGFYRPGEEIEVKLVTDTRTRTSFRGFILEARAVVNGQTNGPIGRWVVEPEDESAWKIKPSCLSDGALTHKHSRSVYSVEGRWVAPATAVGDIVFVASVVRNFNTFWVNITSPILREYRPPAPTSAPQMNSTRNCSEGNLEELTDERPGLAILCYEDTHCPCGWVCCSQCGLSAPSLCRKPRNLGAMEDSEEEVEVEGPSLEDVDNSNGHP